MTDQVISAIQTAAQARFWADAWLKVAREAEEVAEWLADETISETFDRQGLSWSDVEREAADILATEKYAEMTKIYEEAYAVTAAKIAAIKNEKGLDN